MSPEEFGPGCRPLGIAPRVACKPGVKLPGLDGRTTNRPGDRLRSTLPQARKEIFGWIKTVGGLRLCRYRGRERMEAWDNFAVAAYNPLRMARWRLASAWQTAPRPPCTAAEAAKAHRPESQRPLRRGKASIPLTS